jgi:hypothetical protein
MSKQMIVAAALIAALAAAPVAVAHEGHAHKMMGTVTTVQEKQLELKAVDGKTSTVTLDEKTKILRGKAKITVQDIKSGERVVVTAREKKGPDGKAMMLASEVRLAEAGASQ